MILATANSYPGILICSIVRINSETGHCSLSREAAKDIPFPGSRTTALAGATICQIRAWVMMTTICTFHGTCRPVGDLFDLFNFDSS